MSKVAEEQVAGEPGGAADGDSFRGLRLRGLKKQRPTIPLKADLSEFFAHAVHLHHAFRDVGGF